MSVHPWQADRLSREHLSIALDADRVVGADIRVGERRDHETDCRPSPCLADRTQVSSLYALQCRTASVTPASLPRWAHINQGMSWRWLRAILDPCEARVKTWATGESA